MAALSQAELRAATGGAMTAANIAVHYRRGKPMSVPPNIAFDAFVALLMPLALHSWLTNPAIGRTGPAARYFDAEPKLHAAGAFLMATVGLVSLMSVARYFAWFDPSTAKVLYVSAKTAEGFADCAIVYLTVRGWLTLRRGKSGGGA
jgi:hypothetical protein